uniref:mitogen-activated protein kinase kinase n=1 Tax=Hemiselmis andersenii TaxID=464988 RepID=A0A6U2F592_HEMAN|mmetsp:Transcript_3044/g.6971  ORF Transcript_3044/g.6971 Transcript_3044/m.6971 type:complete len:536 (+) Transcript_3044:211-1818(+)
MGDSDGDDDQVGELQLDKGWMHAKRGAKRSGGSVPMGLTVDHSHDEGDAFNLSESGSYREGLLHISQAGTTIHGADALDQHSPSPAQGGSTSAKRANRSEARRYEMRPADFQNMEKIGAGSSGYVRKARWKKRDTIVAIKVINVFETEKRKQMMQEVLMMCDMGHCDALIKFEGAFYHEGTIQVVLEYMTAGSLEDLIELSGAGIPETILAYMTEQIVEGMAFMHKENQVHRDFKPCNVLVHHNGRVKISDFGVSAELDNSMVKCTTFVGTFLYMSPERFGSEPYSFPSDIWSLGLTLMQCATGEYPYLRNSGKAYWELMEAIVQKEAPRLPENKYSEGLERMLEMCLQKDFTLRPKAEKLKNSDFIVSHCATTPPAARLSAISEWVGHVRSCFVSVTSPSSNTFSAADLACNFAHFYASFFQPHLRETLWSLYEESIVLSVGQEMLNGRNQVMGKLRSVEASLEISHTLKDQDDWSKTAKWDSAGLVLALTVPCIVKSAKTGPEGSEACVEFDLKADLKRRCWTVTRQSLPLPR